MPLYDYDCSGCGLRFEVMHGVHVDGPTACPACGSDRLRKAFAAPAVHFKGSGWAKKERRATASSGSTKADSSESGSASDSGGGGKAGDTGRDAKASGGDSSDSSRDAKREARDSGRDGTRESGREDKRDSSDRAAKPSGDSKPATAASSAAD